MGSSLCWRLWPGRRESHLTPTQLSVAESADGCQSRRSSPNLHSQLPPLRLRRFLPTHRLQPQRPHRVTATQAVLTSSELCKLHLCLRCHHPGWDADASKHCVHENLESEKLGHMRMDNQLQTSLFLWRGDGRADGGSGEFGPNRRNCGYLGQFDRAQQTGKLTGAWTLVDDKGQHFGAILTVVINVVRKRRPGTGMQLRRRPLLQNRQRQPLKHRPKPRCHRWINKSWYLSKIRI